MQRAKKIDRFQVEEIAEVKRHPAALSLLQQPARLTAEQVHLLLNDTNLLRDAFKLIIAHAAQKEIAFQVLDQDRVDQVVVAVSKDTSLKHRLKNEIAYDPHIHDNFSKILALVPAPLYKQVLGFLNRSKVLLFSFLVYAIVINLPVSSQTLTANGQAALAVFSMAIILWVSEALPLAITALFVCVMLFFSGAVEKPEAFIGYSANTLFFLLGAFTLGRVIIKSNLHKRISLFLISRFGKNIAMVPSVSPANPAAA